MARPNNGQDTTTYTPYEPLTVGSAMATTLTAAMAAKNFRIGGASS